MLDTASKETVQRQPDQPDGTSAAKKDAPGGDSLNGLRLLQEESVLPRQSAMTEADAIAFCSALTFGREETAAKAEKKAKELADCHDAGYGDYLSLALLLVRQNPHARQGYLKMWQAQRAAIIEDSELSFLDPEQLFTRITPAAAAMLPDAAQGELLGQYTQRLSLEFYLNQIAVVRECRQFLGGSDHEAALNCDDLTSMLIALGKAVGLPHYPEISCITHLCQYDPRTGLVFDNNGCIMTKVELVAEYPSGYYLTADEYAHTQLDQSGTVIGTCAYEGQIHKAPRRYSLVSNLRWMAVREQDMGRDNYAECVGRVIDQLAESTSYHDYLAGLWRANINSPAQRRAALPLLEKGLEEAVLRDSALRALGVTCLKDEKKPWPKSREYLKQVVPRMRHASDALKYVFKLCESRRVNRDFMKDVGLIRTGE